MSSTHKVEVVRARESFPIEGADKIVRVDVFGGFPCVVQKHSWDPNELLAYVQPDSLVPVSRPEFAFLNAPGNGVRADGTVRIRTRRFKKQLSMGLLVPAPEGSREGDDVASLLGVTHYEPPEKGPEFTPPSATRIEKLAALIFRRSVKYGEKPPGIHVPYYDIEPLRRFPEFYDGHSVVVTEKVHGSNVSYCWHYRGLMHRIFRPEREHHLRVRSRTVWKSPEDNWYHCTAVTEEIKSLLSRNTNLVLYGEVYGPGVQKGFHYGVASPRFVAFDAFDWKRGEWILFPILELLCESYGVPVVPKLYQGPYDFETATSLAEGDSILLAENNPISDPHVREGIVVKSLELRPGIRQLKQCGIGYYELS